MGAVQSFSFTNFIDAIKQKVHGIESHKIANSTELASIFDIAAREDSGSDNSVYETDHNGFMKFVNSAVSKAKELYEISNEAILEKEKTIEQEVRKLMPQAIEEEAEIMSILKQIDDLSNNGKENSKEAKLLLEKYNKLDKKAYDNFLNLAKQLNNEETYESIIAEARNAINKAAQEKFNKQLEQPIEKEEPKFGL